MNYYNDNDPVCAYVLKGLVDAGVLPAGDVDSRSITEVTNDDIKGYTQVHLFAGGGLWPLAAKAIGWTGELWTGSCPCQPFSAAGRHKGTSDPRHLWPHYYRLISAHRPAYVVGEQVSGKPGYGWLDGVFDDLEAEDYTCGAADVAACAVDAPHQRSRLYWWGKMADPDSQPGQQNTRSAPGNEEKNGRWAENNHRFEREDEGGVKNVGNSGVSGLQGHSRDVIAPQRRQAQNGQAIKTDNSSGASYWSDAEWIECYDGKARRTQPGIRFLVNGISLVVASGDDGIDTETKEYPKGRIEAWKIAGNAIVYPLAVDFLRSIQ